MTNEEMQIVSANTDEDKDKVLAGLQCNIESLRTDLLVARNMANDWQGKFEDYKSKVESASFIDGGKELRYQNNQLLKKLEQKERELTVKEAEINTMKSQINDYVARMEGVDPQRVLELESALKVERKENKALSSRNANLVASCNDLKKDIKALLRDKNDLKQDNDFLLKQRDSAKAEDAARHHEIAALNRVIDKLVDKLTDRE